MIAQKSAEFRIKPVADGFRVLDRNLHNHGVYPTRDAAETHILTLTATRTQTRRAAHDLAQTLTHAAATAAVALALLITPVGAQAGGSKTCRTIPHGRACYVDGRLVSVVCRSGYELSPGYGTRCVRRG